MARDPLDPRRVALITLAVGTAMVLAGVLGGYVWMRLFPHPEWRFPATPVLAGFFLGFYFGPSIGVGWAFRKLGAWRVLGAAIVGAAVWASFWVLVAVVSRPVPDLRGWVFAPVPFVLYVAGMAISGAATAMLFRSLRRL